MAFSKNRKGRDEQSAAPAVAQSVEAVRRRAIHRLIGAAVLVLAGVIGFPLVFDNQPRPIPVDLPIVIVDKNKVKPLAPPAPVSAVVAAAPAAAPTPAAASAVEPPAPAPVAAAVETPAPTVAKAAASAPTVAKAAASAPTVAKAAASAPAIPDARALDASKAQAILEGRDGAAKAAGSDDRFVVQIGAFAEPDKVRDVRQKVEGAGLKTYTQVVETKDGSRTRVRVGPFSDKEEANRVADKIRKLELPAAILTL